MEQNQQKEQKRTKELLDAAEKRKHNLEMKKEEFGRPVLTAEELAELRELEEKIPQLKENLDRLRR